MYDDFIAERIAKLRMVKGVSARDMSLSLGQAESYINKIENRQALPSMTAFFNICLYLEITPQEFFYHENNNPKRLNELNEILLKLDDESLQIIIDMANKLENK